MHPIHTATLADSMRALFAMSAAVVRPMWLQPPGKGLRARQLRNAHGRARGQEPMPGPFAGVKRHARYIRRTSARVKLVERPEIYLHHNARLAYAKKILVSKAMQILVGKAA